MHSIRLRHPWQCEINGNTTVWSRKFNWPAELTPGEIVKLVIKPIASVTALSLNGTSLIPNAEGEFDITLLIAKSNQLTITSPAAPSDDSGQCPFEVHLEIVERL